MTDKQLRTIGTDLHDGPAQSIGFAVLRLDQVRRLSKAAERNIVVADVEETLGTAMSEIRAIAMALVLPDIENLDLTEVIDRAIKQHVRRTGTVIAVDSMVEPVHVAPEVAVCVFRFIQEGLNNAFHHGLPDGQSLSAVTQRGMLKLSIANNYVEGEHAQSTDHLGIGLYGLRARVQSIGGNFTFMQSNGQTRLEMWLRNV
jgi:signal transduction histidine kinase